MVNEQQLDIIPISFDRHRILEIVIDLFPMKYTVEDGRININGAAMKPYDVYSELENNIFDLRKQEGKPERKAFYELLELMSWAIYRVWCKLIKEVKDCVIIEFTAVNKAETLKLFSENLECDEGAPLRRFLT